MREKRGAVPALVAACGGGCMNRSKTLLGYVGASPANLLLLLILCWSIPIALPSLSPSAPDPVAVGAQLGTVTKLRNSNAPPNVTVSPSFLDYRRRPTCIPATEKVVVSNTAAYESLVVYSITTESVDFQPTFFHKLTVGPGESASFSVLFLARNEGVSFGTLVIETSVGGFLVQVQGEGVPNAYNAKPLLDVKVPMGLTIQPQLEIFNPFNKPLKIKEVFTNEGFLHLVLPKRPDRKSKDTNDMSHEHNSWEVASLSRPRTASSKIKDADTLVIPIELNVIKGGIHRIPDVLDFETITSAKGRAERRLSLLNSTPNPVAILEVVLSTPDPLLQIIFKRGSVVLAPNSEEGVATVVYMGKSEGNFVGTLLVRTNDTSHSNKVVEVPYKATVLYGSIAYSEANTSFPIGSAPYGTIEKTVVVTNKFSRPLQLFTASVDHSNFQVSGLSADIIVMPNENAPPITLRFLPDDSHTLFTTALALHTNVSVFRIPLTAYHGRLELEAPGPDGEITFGTVGLNVPRSEVLKVTNPNPIPVAITSFRGPSRKVSSLSVKLHDVRDNEGNVSAEETKGRALRKLLAGERGLEGWLLKPGYTLALRLDVLSAQEEEVEEQLVFTTDVETLMTKVSFQSMAGQLSSSPSTVQFPSTFAGRLVQEPVFVTSTFQTPLTVKDVSSTDPRVSITLVNATLFPSVPTYVGDVVFDASKGSPEDDYMASAVWTGPASGVVRRSDVELQAKTDATYAALLKRGGQHVSAELQLDFGVTAVKLAGRATLERAEMLRPSETGFAFNLTQLGHPSSLSIPVANPSDRPVFVQMLLSPGVDGEDELPCKSEEACVQSSAFLVPLSLMTGITMPPQTEATLGPVYFVPKRRGLHSALLYLRTNLTFLTELPLTGEGGTGLLEISDGSSPPQGAPPCPEDKALCWPITMRAERDAAAEHRGGVARVTQTVTLQNKGTLPIQVHSVGFGHGACEVDGLRLDDLELCPGAATAPFDLRPDASRVLSVSFASDCTVRVIETVLEARTSVGLVTRRLVASVPEPLLRECFAARARESPVPPGARAACGCAAMLLAGVVVLAAVLEGAAGRRGCAGPGAAEVLGMEQEPASAPPGGESFHAAALAHIARINSKYVAGTSRTAEAGARRAAEPELKEQRRAQAAPRDAGGVGAGAPVSSGSAALSAPESPSDDGPSVEMPSPSRGPPPAAGNSAVSLQGVAAGGDLPLSHEGAAGRRTAAPIGGDAVPLGAVPATASPGARGAEGAAGAGFATLEGAPLGGDALERRLPLFVGLEGSQFLSSAGGAVWGAPGTAPGSSSLFSQPQIFAPPLHAFQDSAPRSSPGVPGALGDPGALEGFDFVFPFPAADDGAIDPAAFLDPEGSEPDGSSPPQ